MGRAGAPWQGPASLLRLKRVPDTTQRNGNVKRKDIGPDMDELDAPPLPGRILLDEYLKPLNVTTAQLAGAINVPEVRITALLNGKAGMLTDTAVRLARYFGTTERYWVDLQSDYDLFWARSRLEYDLSLITPLGAGTERT